MDLREDAGHIAAIDLRATRLLRIAVISATALLLLLGWQTVARAQEPQTKSREITSEDFTKNRPASPAITHVAGGAKTSPQSVAQESNSKKRRRVYRWTAIQNAYGNLAAPPPPTSTLRKSPALFKRPPVESVASVEEVGITVWQLRPSTLSDTGPKIIVPGGGDNSSLTPVRVESGAQLKVGEKVRLSIESPREGYLYVIDREQYKDGAMGDALLIFPTTRTRNGNNRVKAGELVDVPGQEDDPPYFTLNSQHAGYVGELLTLIVTPQPLKDFQIGKLPLLITPVLFSTLERQWSAEAELFEMEQGAGASWTAEEQSASRVNGRQLTQGEPTPQTIYRVAVKPGNPLFVTVPLHARP
ncbi:MAG: DUF4384 domain-containing protein [Pyrinomonadaceae bacterium]